MAVRSCRTRWTSGTATTTTFVLAVVFGIATAMSTAVANQSWDNEPVPSVVVESAAPPEGFTFAGDSSAGFASERLVAGGPASPANADSVAFAGDGVCSICNGNGCNQCQPSAVFDLSERHCRGKNACWIGRVDALLLWRNAPPGGQIVTNDTLVNGDALAAAGMDSSPAAGPRFSIFRVNNCTGNAIEATYLRAANFRSLRPLGQLDVPYALAPAGIYGNTGLTFDTANADLGARVQSFEFNRHHCIAPNVRFLAGFRWIEWQEQFSMQADSLGGVSDYFQTNCINDLYGGQIGLDANLLSLRWIRFDSVVKAGAYYTNAVQSSLYTTNDPLNPGTAAVTVGQSPLSGAFAGEVGLTGVIPLTCCLDFRFGYFGLWLSGIAQPTQQLAHQQLTPGVVESGTINSNGGVLLQGVSLGLEGRW